MRVWLDAIEEAVSPDPGLGPLILLGATPGNLPFSHVGDGNECDVRVEQDDLLRWEVGSATYDAGSNRLIRGDVFASSSGPGVHVNLTGACTAYLTFAACRVGNTSETPVTSGGRLPLVTGERTADGEPVLVSDPLGQCVGVPVE